jgi:hypothetical protein
MMANCVSNPETCGINKTQILVGYYPQKFYVGLDLQDNLNKIRRDFHGMLYPQRSTHWDSLHGIVGGNFLVISWDPLGDHRSKDYKKMSRTHGVNHVGKTEHPFAKIC